jgi:hypothetical protein
VSGLSREELDSLPTGRRPLGEPTYQTLPWSRLLDRRGRTVFEAADEAGFGGKATSAFLEKYEASCSSGRRPDQRRWEDTAEYPTRSESRGRPGRQGRCVGSICTEGLAPEREAKRALKRKLGTSGRASAEPWAGADVRAARAAQEDSGDSRVSLGFLDRHKPGDCTQPRRNDGVRSGNDGGSAAEIGAFSSAQGSIFKQAEARAVIEQQRRRARLRHNLEKRAALNSVDGEEWARRDEENLVQMERRIRDRQRARIERRRRRAKEANERAKARKEARKEARQAELRRQDDEIQRRLMGHRAKEAVKQRARQAIERSVVRTPKAHVSGAVKQGAPRVVSQVGVRNPFGN